MYSPNKSRILLADHDQTFLDQLADRLLQMDLEVDFAENGRIALKLVESESYDLIITEIAMPIFNGLEILRKAKEQDPNTEILILSYSATTDWAEQAVKEGAYAILMRPLNNMKEFDKAVQKGLDRKQSGVRKNSFLQNAISEETDEQSWTNLDIPKPSWEIESSTSKSDSNLELSKPQPLEAFTSFNRNGDFTSQNLKEDPQNAFSSLPEGAFELNPLGQIMSCDPAARKWLMLEANDPERPIRQLIKALPNQSVPENLQMKVNDRTAVIRTKRIQDRSGSERIILIISEAKIEKQTSTSPGSPVKVNGGTQRPENSRKESISFSSGLKKYDADTQDHGWSPIGFFDQMKNTIKDEVEKIKENHLFQMLEQQPEEADPEVIMTMSRRLNDVSQGRRTSY